MIDWEKRCTKCKQIKAFSEFYKGWRRIDGLKSECKKCHNEYSRLWRIKNKKKAVKYLKEYKKINKEKLSKYWKNYGKLNKERRTENRRIWAKKNRERSRAVQRKWTRMKRATDPKYRCNMNMSGAIRVAIRGGKNGKKWEQIVGYTLKDLIKHLESQFDEKMSWDNYGPYWHIDHIKPKNRFNYQSSDDVEFKKCWALENLQPLEAYKNFAKH